MKMLISTAIAAAAFAALPAQAAPFINGSFEDGPAVGSFTTLGAGSTAINGWTVGGDSIDYIGSYWMHDDGARSIDLSGNGAGSIFQTFDTIAGQRYRVTFALAGNPAGGPALKTGTVDVNGALQAFTFDTSSTTLAAMGWTPLSYIFTAGAGPTSTLTFTSTTATSFGPALDNVAVAGVVPEPATWAMMIMGFGLIGAAMRRTKPRVNVSFA